MIKTVFTAVRTASFTGFARLAGVILLSVSLFANSQAQTTSTTDGSTPLGLAPGAPAGSYALSGFYNVNLNFRLPLMHINGRGGTGYTMLLPIERRWTVTQDVIPEVGVFNYPEDNWWSDDVKPGYGLGVMHRRLGGSGAVARLICRNAEGQIEYYNKQTVTRLTFTAADGTEFNLVDQLTQGLPAVHSSCPPHMVSRGTVFVSTDGTSATFISDTTIYDGVGYGSGGANSSIYGYLILRDGTRYRINNGVVAWIRDRNGNLLTFTYDSSRRVTSITDSLNRQVTIVYDVADGAPYGVCDRITVRGFGGATRIIRVSKTNLGSALRSDYSLQTPSQLFPPLNGSTFGPHDPPVVSAVWLPDSDGVTRKYQFFYNSYDELARVALPTGGAFEYDWAPGLSGGADGGAIDYSTGYHIYRRVIEKRVYPDGVTLAQKMTFSRPETYQPYIVTTLGYVVVDQLDAGGTLLARQQHYFHGNGGAASLNQGPISQPPWYEGREYQTDEFAANGATLLRRVAHTWQDSTTFGQGPHIIETTTTLLDTNQVAKQTFSYASYNNQIDIREYDFVSGAPPAYPTRHTHTDYLTSGYDTNANIHLRNLPSQQLVYAVNPSTGAETLASHVTYEYDLYDGSPNHAPLVDRPGISGLDSGFTTGYITRGNVTKVSRWLDTPSSWIDTYAQYDVAGNVVKTINGRGYATNFEFNDRFGSPDGEARANSAPSELGGQTSYAFATKVTDALGQTVYTQYDYYLGRAVDVEDHNGVVSSGYYNDALDRTTQIISANTASPTDPNRSQSTFTYNEASHLITTTSDRDAFGDNLLKSEIVYDGLGRTVEARTYAPGPAGCSSPCYSLVKTIFDAMGRTYQVSNPYWNHESPIWTTTQYDALSRVTSVTTPDGATVSTAYNGAQVTVTDQAGKKRRSQTDAFGRLTMVTEDPGGLNFDTIYFYDALGNLRKVTQGAQTRWFAYDSLSRLIRVKNPEQNSNGSLPAYTDPVTGGSGWAMAYSYDANGNLTQRIDARGIVTNYFYDGLNRNWGIDYINGSQTSNLVRVFDGAVNGKGRLYWDRTMEGGTQELGTAVTANAIDSYDALGRPLTKRQHFWQGSGWSPAYAVQHAYDLAGNVKTQTYPSGRTVKYSHDQAGRLSSFSGNLGGSPSTYAATIGYNAAGQMIKERFGTNTSLYHNQHYNCRLQLADTRLGDSATDEWNWSRGAIGFKYGTTAVATGNDFAYDTDNNGNLRRQNYYVPLASGGYVISQLDDYYYDPLNRIAAVREQQRNESGQWADSVSQAYSYDRWGNRTLDLSGGGSGAVVWVDDALPQGATPGSDGGDSWTWVSSNPIPYSGTVSHQSAIAAGVHQHYFYGATQKLQVNAGDRLYAYVYLDPANTPSEVMLQWADGSGWEHRAYWGANNIGWGANGTASRRYMGPLPATGGWVRLEVPASAVGLEGKTVDGMAFTLCDGRATWDKAGKVGLMYGAGPPINNRVYAVDAGRNRLTAVNGVEMIYDAAGNQTDDGSGQRTYDGENRMLTATNGGVGSSYTYDADGRRVRRIVGGLETWHVYGIGGELLVEYAAGAAPSAPQKVYGYRNGQLLVVSDASETGDRRMQWLVQDHLGSTRMVVDGSGSLGGVRRHDFAPFGEELGAGVGIRSAALGYGDDSVRQKFAGYERDIESGLDFAEARYYANVQGRFTSVDPYNAVLERQYAQDKKEGEKQFLAYLNIPLAYIDPTGEAIELVGSEEERKKQLEALKQVVGKEAGTYLYENKVTDKSGTRYFVGILGNGPSGKGPAFENINSAAGEVAAIIRDPPIQRIGIVSEGTTLTNDSGHSTTIGPIDKGLSPGVTSMYGGHWTSYILDPATKPGYLPGVYMSDGMPSQPTTGELLGHELGHGRARATGDPNSNDASLRIENKVRTEVNHKKSTRIIH